MKEIIYKTYFFVLISSKKNLIVKFCNLKLQRYLKLDFNVRIQRLKPLGLFNFNQRKKIRLVKNLSQIHSYMISCKVQYFHEKLMKECIGLLVCYNKLRCCCVVVTINMVQFASFVQLKSESPAINECKNHIYSVYYFHIWQKIHLLKH